ncbi:MAG TPA: thiamine pyrophosphate-dependent enzyme, partial [Candidatus Binatia bacterium]|nr:thiamine pyrophosphate-dependent enzyme [Candidatus Binatia bacterium]
LAEWKKKDPIARVARALKRKRAIDEKQLQQIEHEARELVDKAAEFALSSPWPASSDLETQVTASTMS